MFALKNKNIYKGGFFIYNMKRGTIIGLVVLAIALVVGVYSYGLTGGTVDQGGYDKSDWVCEVLYSSMDIAGIQNVEQVALDIPEICFGGRCLIKQEIFGEGGIVRRRGYEYIQVGSEWVSTYKKEKTAGMNGDEVSSDVILHYGPPTRKIKLLDDLSGVETNAEQWVLNDDSEIIGARISVCEGVEN